MREVQIIACEGADGVIRRTIAFVKIERSGLSDATAEEAGFALEEDGEHWARELTPEIVARETRDGGWIGTKVLPARLKIENGVMEQSPDFPADTTFREAWMNKAGKIDVDMPKARDIHRARLRALRKPVLDALDIEYQRADERGDAKEKQRIAAKKQALRDVTTDPAIEAATTPDELKAIMPEALRS